MTTPTTMGHRRHGRLALRMFCGLVFAFLMLPLLIVFPVSISDSEFLTFPPVGFSWRWYAEFLGSSSWMNALGMSLKVGLGVVLVCLLAGVPVSFVIARSRHRWLSLAVDRIVVAPMVVPAIVTAIAVYAFFARWQAIGTWSALVIGHSLISLPVCVIVLTAGLRQFDLQLENAAVGLGAGRLRAIGLVTVPMLAPPLLSAMFLVFMTSFDDLIVALFLSGSSVTLPKKMFENIGYAFDPTMAAVSSLEIVALLTIGGLWYVVHRSLQRRKAPSVATAAMPQWAEATP